MVQAVSSHILRCGDCGKRQHCRECQEGQRRKCCVALRPQVRITFEAGQDWLQRCKTINVPSYKAYMRKARIIDVSHC